MQTHFQAGRILYFGPRGENGRETFEMVSHANGRTLRAFCEMDDEGLSRDVTMALDAESRPLDAFVRVIQHGAVTGTTLFRVAADAIRCDGWTQDHGDVSQRLPLRAPLRYLGLHPLVGDALIARVRGTDAPGEFRAIPGIANSLSPNGEKGLIAMPTVIDVAYQGRERVAVHAGSFDALRYGLRWNPAWPVADLWVHGPEALFLRLTWDYIGARYELTQLTRVR
jgi:hypothetical protein